MRALLLLIGFTAAIAQIVLLRELMVVFNGNEISIGLVLASWLLWTAAGSCFAGRLGMALLQVLCAASLPLTILAVRASKGVLQTVPGESLGPGTMLFASWVLLGPFCLVSGGLFAAGSRLWESSAGDTRARATGTVYLLETAGWAIGGLLAGLVLIRYLGALETAFLLAVMNLLGAVALLVDRPAVALWITGGLGALLLVTVVPRLETWSIERFWRGFQVLAVRNSNYGNLVVVGTEGSRSVYENGSVLFNAPDPAAAEENVHYALLEHPSPHRLLLIGGGLNGSLTEALKHPGIERIDYVELDPAILELAREHFRIPTDPRIHLHVADGRSFLKAAGPTYDVILVNAPEPQTAQLNRFYTVEFFREAAARLATGGLLSFRLPASENYISPELAEFLRSIYKTLGNVFPEVVVIPGESVHFFAALQPGVLVSQSDALLARLRARRIATTYVSEAFLPFRMMPDRMLEIKQDIQPRPDTPINRDFAPIAYYFNVALWSGQFQPAYRHVFAWLASVRFSALAGVAVVLLVTAAWFSRRPRGAAAFCTASTGFTMIGLELLLLLAFQAKQGYVYQQLAIVIAAFMAGMALGSWLALRRPAHSPRELALVQVLIAIAPIALYGVFGVVAQPLLFPAMAVVCGTLGGYQFPVASSIYFAARERRSPGALYALDLAGSCLAALLISAWLVPVFSFLNAALLMALVSAAPVLSSLWSSRTPAP